MHKLTGIPLFKDVEIDLAPFETRVHWRHVDPDVTVVDFHEPSSDIYFLHSGEVRVQIRTRSGKEVILGDLKAGSLFGELAALDSVKRSANVTALTRAELCVMSAAVFREIVFTAPVVADRLFRILTRRVREMTERLLEHSVLDLRHRLYSELLRNSVERSGCATERVVTPPPYHHVIAAKIGCRREQVTREFTAMDGEGLIERTRGALVLKRPDVLHARIASALRDDY